MARRWTLFCAGLWMFMVPVVSQLSEDQEQQIVNQHNAYRAVVKPDAADMVQMTWDKELATVASEYATKCKWEHNPDVLNTKGENLFITTGPLDIFTSLEKWFEEEKEYTYDINTCAENQMCGHYTQMVWAKTTMVGCGTHFCEVVEGLDITKATMLVCNYYPPGNTIGRKPYEAGQPCSKCPEESMGCLDNTCINIDRAIVTSAQPTELWTTDTTNTKPVGRSASGRPSAAPLMLTGLLAFLMWM